MRSVPSLLILAAFLALSSVNAFAPISARANVGHRAFSVARRMSEKEPTAVEEGAPVIEEEEEEPMDEATRLQLEKQRRADELRAQEVFIQRSTGKHECSNCGWEFDVEKGDSMMIGGMVKPGTEFSELPSNWRCPVCRASKDSFNEVTEEIPGFEVNQGYGFGGNSMTAGQKNGIIFGGLGFFFFLFLAGYGLS
uniref:Rubredoxin-like domain-containing protein n=1 Tax=Helicotheca tamesis TaxID=374047 RepID=A0A7S2MK67_9STRA|mmetsp:Transcript_17262/g.23763  ORF Transcript_17262/g.23763 Transcript_17262/m.23763 type:complete len:195 (+) Transcript_17262:120-704(+)|eukprot:CAMPEP_0185729264 /NCGR_PEP_ID=MMETSP1171-20130828/4985_1 /TAXON_ID=374046 /ORGANISM="Helicotheca tamensis, Strain CCMP826" /LENGTH=194 /DNA_ID=CAMNT_0028398061 /DNA_START=67 /DNA_END=651 /DNA_ORIENTATION=-